MLGRQGLTVQVSSRGFGVGTTLRVTLRDFTYNLKP